MSSLREFSVIAIWSHHLHGNCLTLPMVITNRPMNNLSSWMKSSRNTARSTKMNSREIRRWKSDRNTFNSETIKPRLITKESMKKRKNPSKKNQVLHPPSISSMTSSPFLKCSNSPTPKSLLSGHTLNKLISNSLPRSMFHSSHVGEFFQLHII